MEMDVRRRLAGRTGLPPGARVSSLVGLNLVEQSDEHPVELLVRAVRGAGSDADQVAPRMDDVRMDHRDRLEAAAEPVAHDRRADRLADGVGDTRFAPGVVGERCTPQFTGSGPSRLDAEPLEGGPILDTPDHADRRARPFPRRDFRIARPARVDMR